MRNFYQEFKTPLVTVAIIFLAFLIYTKVFGPVPFYVNSVSTTKNDLFSASGQGKVTQIPDTAEISIGVTKQSPTVSDAQNQVNVISSKVIADLKKLGIAESDIKTTNYSVNPNYNPPVGTLQPQNQNPNGYEVTQNIQVKVRPIEKVNKAIDASTSDGANLVGGINFTFSDSLQKELEQKATQMAVDDAKSNAQNLANAAGVKLGPIVNVVSSVNNAPPIYPMAASQKEGLGSAPTTITPGQNTIDIGVTIYYETY